MNLFSSKLKCELPKGVCRPEAAGRRAPRALCPADSRKVGPSSKAEGEATRMARGSQRLRCLLAEGESLSGRAPGGTRRSPDVHCKASPRNEPPGFTSERRKVRKDFLMPPHSPPWTVSEPHTRTPPAPLTIQREAEAGGRQTSRSLMGLQ